LFEYACHEGNEAMVGILGGARYEDRQKQERDTCRSGLLVLRSRFSVLRSWVQVFRSRFWPPSNRPVEGYPENPIQRAPAPTPNHNASETTPPIVHAIGLMRPPSANTTRRRTVYENIIASASELILNQNGVL